MGLDRGRRRGRGGAGLGVLAAAAWRWKSPTVKQGRFEQAIEEDGRTRLKERYAVSAPVAARLARITLREGDSVAAGDTVAVLTPVMSSHGGRAQRRAKRGAR